MPVSPDDAAFLQRALAGQYSIDREIGRGGMGVVYLAREVILDRLVAIKVLPTELAGNADSRERFLREARTAAKLFHPHIVPIHRVDTVGDAVFIAMGFVDGQSANQRVAEQGPMPISQAIRVLRETAWALSYAHGRGVIHRDIKPDNLLLERESGRTFVTDFGIAQVEGVSSLTRDGQMFGSVSYMSPEQIGGGEIDGRSDLYSLGIVAHYLLTGKVPFAHAAATAVLTMHLRTPAPPIASLVPGIPPKLAAAIDRCLVKDAADRHPSIDAFASALTEIETRRDTPPALRAWIAGSGMVDPGFWTVAAIAIVVMVLAEGGASWAMLATPIAYVGVQRSRQTRRVMQQGFGVEDFRAALAAEIDRETEATATQVETRVPMVARVLRGISRAALWTMGVIFVYEVAISMYGYDNVAKFQEQAVWLFVEVPILAFLWAAAIWIGTGLVASLIAPVAAPVDMKVRELRARLRFWGSSVGNRFAKFLRFGLGRVRGTGRTDQPTEMVLGAAAAALFEALPSGVRQQMLELPTVVAGLEGRATRLRARIREIETLAAQVRPASPANHLSAAGSDDRHTAIERDFAAGRRRAEEQLGTAVAALETIRLDLLRLHAGNGAVHDLTANVDAAARLAAEIDHALAGQEAVETLLARPSIQARGFAPKSPA